MNKKLVFLCCVAFLLLALPMTKAQVKVTTADYLRADTS